MLELLHLLKRNKWLLEGKYALEGMPPYDYRDQTALGFRSGFPDVEQIYPLSDVKLLQWKKYLGGEEGGAQGKESGIRG